MLRGNKIESRVKIEVLQRLSAFGMLDYVNRWRHRQWRKRRHHKNKQLQLIVACIFLQIEHIFFFIFVCLNERGQFPDSLNPISSTMHFIHRSFNSQFNFVSTEFDSSSFNIYTKRISEEKFDEFLLMSVIVLEFICAYVIGTEIDHHNSSKA